MKVLVCGGRDFNDAEAVHKALAAAHPSIIIHGGASGADALADAWARKRGIPVVVFRAEWGKHGRAAGPIRNRRMAEQQPDLVLAFPGGRGTANMIALATEKGLTVIQPRG